METNTSYSKKINILLNGGLNQIYTKLIDKFCTYSNLYEYFLMQCGCPEDLLSTIINYSQKLSTDFHSNRDNIFNSNLLLEEFFKKIESELDKNFSLDITKFIFNPKDFMLLEQEIAKEIKNKKISIIILHDDLINIYLEQKILKACHLDCYFSLKLRTDIDLNTEISKIPKNFVYFDYQLDNLLNYHRKGLWTVYLTNYLFTSLTFHINDNPYYQLNKDNLNILKSQGRFFNFSVFVFYEIKNYFDLIIKVNQGNESITSNKNKLEEEIDTLNPIRVLVFYKFFFKKLEYLRAKHFNSNEKVMFISYVGSLYMEDEDEIEFSINGKVNCILIKLNEKQDKHYLQSLINKFNSLAEMNKNILLINSLKNIDSFLERHKMIIFLEKFCESTEVKKINEKFGLKVKLPKCYSVRLEEVYEEKQFKEFILKNELSLPLIIKYTGPRKDFNHLMVTICTEEGIRNYVEFMKNYALGLQSSIELVIQSYVNHGGYVIKLYHANSTGYIYTRPSLPDVSDDLITKFEEYKLGFYRISTEELLSRDYFAFWEKLHKNEKIKDIINKDYMYEVSRCFQNFSEVSLFGLDFLYDYVNKEYYLIDCNLYPGYKELLHEFNGILTDHICGLYKEFLTQKENKTQKI